MSSLFDPRNLTNTEFVRIADTELLKGPLPLAWQLSAIDRIHRLSSASHHAVPDRYVPAAVAEGQSDGRE
jgi:hypothetical protein